MKSQVTLPVPTLLSKHTEDSTLYHLQLVNTVDLLRELWLLLVLFLLIIIITQVLLTTQLSWIDITIGYN